MSRANGADSIFQRSREGLEINATHLSRLDHDSQRKFHSRTCPKLRIWNFRQERQGAEVDRAVSRLSLSPLALHRAAGNAQRSRGHLARRHGEGFQGSRVSQRIQKTHDHTIQRRSPGRTMETAIRELPRDPETVALYKKMAEHGPAAAAVRRRSSNRSSYAVDSRSIPPPKPPRVAREDRGRG